MCFGHYGASETDERNRQEAERLRLAVLEHQLVVSFGRVLSEDEWRDVVTAVKACQPQAALEARAVRREPQR
jgi:hypothetical protein